MADITLGSDEHSLSVLLTKGADFVAYIDAAEDEPDWPASLALELRFDAGVTWTATRTNARTLTFAVDKAGVDTLLALNPRRASLFAVDGTVDERWARGSVAVRG